MSRTPTVIGLGGRLRAGKDAVADHLVSEHGFVKLGMSDALHEALLAIDPIIGGECERYSELVGRLGYVEAKKNPEVRRLLQALGTEVGRNMIGEDVWSTITAGKVVSLLRQDLPVVVTGIRFPNELAMIRQLAGACWWVERETEAPSAVTAGHASENSVTAALFDRVIHNDGSLADLYRKVDELTPGRVSSPRRE